MMEKLTVGTDGETYDGVSSSDCLIPADIQVEAKFFILIRKGLP